MTTNTRYVMFPWHLTAQSRCGNIIGFSCYILYHELCYIVNSGIFKNNLLQAEICTTTSQLLWLVYIGLGLLFSWIISSQNEVFCDILASQIKITRLVWPGTLHLFPDGNILIVCCSKSVQRIYVAYTNKFALGYYMQVHDTWSC